MKNTELFNVVMEANKDYVEALTAGADKNRQAQLLARCNVLMEMVIEKGLAVEYGEYCVKLRSIVG